MEKQVAESRKRWFLSAVLGRDSPERLWHLGNILKPSHCGTGQLTQESRKALRRTFIVSVSSSKLLIAFFVESKASGANEPCHRGQVVTAQFVIGASVSSIHALAFSPAGGAALPRCDFPVVKTCRSNSSCLLDSVFSMSRVIGSARRVLVIL